MKREQWFAVIAVVLVAIFAAVFQLSGDPGDMRVTVAVAPQEGFRILSDNPVAVAPGEEAVFRIEVQDGYRYSSVSAGEYENGMLTVPTSYFGKTVYMTVLRECGISVSSNGNGAVELLSGSRAYQGDTVSVQLRPDENYEPGPVYIGPTAFPAPSGEVYEFTVSDDTHVEFTFRGKPVDFMMVCGNLGTVAAAGYTDVYRYGDDLELSCRFDEKHIVFDGWSVGGYLSDGGDLVSAEAVCSYMLDGDTVLYANLRDRSSYLLTYDSNGGSQLNELSGMYAPGEYLNIALSDGNFYREGWTLMGFSTQPENGELITPGGMMLMPREEVTLYAQWAQHTPADQFSYTEKKGKITITGFSEKGLEAAPAELVIPDTIEGKTVTEIGSEAFYGCDFLRTVVLPAGLTSVQYNSFADCTGLTTVYFPETLTELSEYAFTGCENFSDMRVIAKFPTVFDYCFDSALADKYMTLTHTEGKRIILVGGSNLAFGIDSALIQEQFPGYSVVNMGSSVHHGMLSHFDILRANVREGDIVIFCPEYVYVVYTVTEAPTMANWQYLESNYDILKDIDLRSNRYLLDQYVEYLSIKRSYLPGKKYESDPVYSRSGFDRFGDLTTSRRSQISYQFMELDISIVTSDGLGRYNELCRELTERGASCCFTFPAYPAGNSTAQEIAPWVDNFATKVTSLLDDRYITVISRIEDCFIQGPVFYDSPYHLTPEGADIRTQRLISDLKVYLEERK